ncbi:Organic cation transporter 1 [Folsomia candida]|uniref:Organic cation transporter 1 n=1 Tax=Folsomia candida TaxID=158441 RepID=A0A226CZZ5_FOLCA|nr:Organic cation transporter 1 [Folsomia candida]
MGSEKSSGGGDSASASDPLTVEPEKTRRPVCSDFDDILSIIGSEGRYQKLLTYGFLAPLMIISPLLELSSVFLFDIPNHWCHVPAPHSSYFSPDNDTAWKNATLPMEVGPDGKLRYSQCLMYDQVDNPFKNRTIPCQNGWDFDKSDYEATVPSEFGWVCDKVEWGADIIASAMAGMAIGTILFGVLADKIGRKPVFFMACVVILVFRGLSLYTPQYFRAYQVFSFLSGTAIATFFNIPMLAIAEVCGTNTYTKDYRSWVYAVVWMVYVVGNCLLPLIAWISREWFTFGMVTTLPVLIMVFFYPVIMESPRWLITAGREEEALETVWKIARINGKEVDQDDLTWMVKVLVERQKKANLENSRVGIWSLFQWPRLAKNTILLCIAWSMNGLLYYGIILNTTNVAGNKFMNYFLLSVIELPSGYLAGRLVEITGRRWTQVGFFSVSLVSCSLCAIASFYMDSTYLVILGALGIKLGVSVSSLVVYLQGAEILPTQLRSSGSALATTISNLIGMSGPYIVLTGKSNAVAPYVILGVVSLTGALAASFLPETFQHHLPETLEDADKFGKNSKFWSYLPKDSIKLEGSGSDEG